MSRLRQTSVSLAVASYLFLAAAPAHAAPIDIAQNPLFLLAPVKPSMVMAVDDSGSMDSELVLATNDGALWWHDDTNGFTGWETNANNTADEFTGSDRLNFNATGANNGTWQKYTYLFPGGYGDDGRRLGNDHYAVPPIPAYAYARSPAFNPIYFDPSVDYKPYPSEGSRTFTNANPADAKFDIILSSRGIDLTKNVRVDNSGWTFNIQRGMVIPAGTHVDDPDEGGSCIAGADWDPALAVPYTSTADECRLAIEYFPATFWLPVGNAPPTEFGFTGVPVVGGQTPSGGAMLGYEIKPANFSSAAAYDRAIQNFANWFQYYRKRVFLTRSAIGQAFAEANFLRVGAFEINDRNAVAMRDLQNATDRQAFFDTQYSLVSGGGTPNKQAVLHIGQQFLRTGTDAPVLQACQKNFGVLFTDGFSNSFTGAGVGNTDGGAGSPLAGTFLADSQSDTMADIAYQFYNNNLRPDLEAGRVPVPTACDSASPPLRLDCQKNLHMNFFAVMLGGIGLEFRRNEAATEDPWTNHPEWPTSFPNRNPSAIDDIWHAALNTRGEAFSADRPQDLIQAFSQLLQEVASSIQPVGVSATSTRLDQDSVFYEAELDSTTWSGDIRALRAADSSVEWQASSNMPPHGLRNILIGTGEAGPVATTFDSGLSAAVRSRIFGSTPMAGDAAAQNAVINYLRGDRSNEEQNGGMLRDRDGIIGDIANSRPQFSGPRNEGWARLDGSYTTYLDDVKAGRDRLVLVGANAGMMHAFDAETGREKFAFIPSPVHDRLAELADPAYSHKFYVDGQIRIADAKLGGWKTVAVGGLGGGGRGVYALDISNPDSVSVMWELTADDHPELGHVYSEPLITRIGGVDNGTWVAIFGNGYNSDAGTPHLFVVDLQSGNVIDKIEMGTTDGNGLSGIAAFLDPISQLFTSRVYGGDLDGNMWRIDFSAGGSASVAFGGRPLVTVDDNRPIASAPTLAASADGGLLVYFGSGKLIESADRVGTPSDFDRFWAVRDNDSRLVNTSGISAAQMTVSDGNRVITGADTGGGDGWYLELGVGSSPTGERVLSRPQVSFGNVIFTTFEPDDDPCSPGGLRRIYALDASDGTGLLGQICPNCGVIEVGLGAPIDPAVVIRPPANSPDFDDGGDIDPFDPGGDGSLPDGSSVGSQDRWCSEQVMLVPGEGFVPFGRICDGRQIWRESR